MFLLPFAVYSKIRDKIFLIAYIYIKLLLFRIKEQSLSIMKLAILKVSNTKQITSNFQTWLRNEFVNPVPLDKSSNRLAPRPWSSPETRVLGGNVKSPPCPERNANFATASQKSGTSKLFSANTSQANINIKADSQNCKYKKVSKIAKSKST